MSIKKYYQLGKNVLYPICRSLTGAGVRKTLRVIKQEFPELKIKNISSGSKVFDWKVPPEWNIDNAYVLDKDNKKIIDFKKNNLHLVGYSIPIDKVVSKKELLDKIQVLPKQPNAIPYSTSYYSKYWGFCLSFNEKKKIIKTYNDHDKFKVIIKSKLNPKGKLNYGELILKGKSKEEILISTYICHPSLANNEMSGNIVSMCLINHFKKYKYLEKTIKFIFIPETIGSIAYLSKNLPYLKSNVIGGYNLTCIGDDRQHSCMLSKYENSPSDRSLIEAYKKLKIKYKKYPFILRGSDERQFNSPGIDLPISSIMRSMYGTYPEYHTSLDNFKVVTMKGITGGYSVVRNAIEILLKKIIPKYKVLCEPQLGKRNLYPKISLKNYKVASVKKWNNRMGDSIYYLHFLQYSDGKNDLESISKLLSIKKNKALKIYNFLKKNKLVT